jgi:hypothetical protein
MRLHLAHNRSPLSAVEVSPPWPVLHTCSIGGNVGTSLGLPSPMIWPYSNQLARPMTIQLFNIFLFRLASFAYATGDPVLQLLPFRFSHPTNIFSSISIDYFHLLFTGSCWVLSNFQHQSPFHWFFFPSQMIPTCWMICIQRSSTIFLVGVLFKWFNPI